MKRRPRLTLILILFATILAVFVNLPTFGNFDQNNLLSKINIQRPLEFRQGLDLSGGASITFRGDFKDIPESQRDSAHVAVKEVIERRVNLFGVSEPIVQTSVVGSDRRVIVEIPGVSDINSAINLIGTTAQLSFWEQGASPSAEVTEEINAEYPLGAVQVLGADPVKTDLSGSDLKQTSVVFNPNTGEPSVQLQFTQDGVEKFADITKRNVGKPVAIVLDNIVISYPSVREAILTGDAVIEGGFTLDQAKALATQLNGGALPVSLSVLEQHVVGPTLGRESLQKSLLAGAIGLIATLIFMIAIYGKRGIIASIALVLYALFTLAVFKLSSLTPYGITLTLAGVAGFILSIGMAVDANILIFERTKEEERDGKPSPSAIELGFKRAWTSIRDSNVSTLITCLILYSFGTGIVKGFAIVLAIGVLISMFTAITVTRTLLRVLSKD